MGRVSGFVEQVYECSRMQRMPTGRQVWCQAFDESGARPTTTCTFEDTNDFRSTAAEEPEKATASSTAPALRTMIYQNTPSQASMIMPCDSRLFVRPRLPNIYTHFTRNVSGAQLSHVSPPGDSSPSSKFKVGFALHFELYRYGTLRSVPLLALLREFATAVRFGACRVSQAFREPKCGSCCTSGASGLVGQTACCTASSCRHRSRYTQS